MGKTMKQPTLQIRKNATSRAFTIVELVIVVVVIAILAGITIIGYGNWREGITDSRVKSDAAGVYTGMQNARNFSKTGYPVLTPGVLFDGSSATSSIFKSSQDVTATYIEGSKAYFCVNVVSTTRTAIKYFVDSRLGSEPKKGDCAGGEYDPSVVGVGKPLIFREESMGTQNMCGIALDNKAYCIGRYIGDGSSVFNAYAPAKLAGASSLIGGSAITKIVSGSMQNCAIAASRAYCWGGTITGDGTSAHRASPLKISGNGALLDTYDVTDISVTNTNNTTFACAVANARLYCWGANTYGVLGNGNSTDAPSPVATLTTGVLQNVNIVKVMTSHYQTSVISDTGKMYIWGYGLPGGTLSTSPTEIPVFADKKVIKVASANYSAYVLTDEGMVYSWGSRAYGQQGDGTTSNFSKSPPSPVGLALSGKNVTDIAATSTAACAVAEGNVYCWGRNHEGQLGIGSTTDTNVPTLVQGALAGKQVRKIRAASAAADGQKYCATTTENKVYCWGSGMSGSGATVFSASNTPVELTSLGTFL